MKVTIREMRELERLFSAEVVGHHARIHNRNMAERLERYGLIKLCKVHLVDRMGAYSMPTHILTHAGRYFYCSRCAAPHAKETTDA